MSKTFTEIVEKKCAKLFTEFKEAPQLVSFVSSGTPIAIASHLRKMMLDNPKEEVSVELGGLMKFTLKINKRGDSVAFTPEFELLEKGLKYIAKDDLSFDHDDCDTFGLALIDSDDLLVACREAIAGKVFNDEEWVDEDTKKDKKGIVFDEESDVAVCVASVIISVIEILANNKDASNEIEYDVAGFGTFKVAQIKDGWSVKLTFDKIFKQHCKSDKLAEKIAKLDIA